MLVRLLVELAGPTYTLEPGDERDFPQAEAIRLIEAGFAVPATDLRIETTEAEAPAERRKRGRPRTRD